MTKIPGKQINPAFKDDMSGPNAYIEGEIRANVKMFEIPHPTLPGKVLVHSCLEGPENAVYARGSAFTDIVKFPDFWKDLVDENSISVHITPYATVETYSLASVTVEGFKIVKNGNIGEHSASFFWIAFATRKDIPTLEIVQDARPEEEDYGQFLG